MVVKKALLFSTKSEFAKLITTSALATTAILTTAVVITVKTNCFSSLNIKRKIDNFSKGLIYGSKEIKNNTSYVWKLLSFIEIVSDFLKNFKLFLTNTYQTINSIILSSISNTKSILNITNTGLSWAFKNFYGNDLKPQINKSMIFFNSFKNFLDNSWKYLKSVNWQGYIMNTYSYIKKFLKNPKDKFQKVKASVYWTSTKLIYPWTNTVFKLAISGKSFLNLFNHVKQLENLKNITIGIFDFFSKYKFQLSELNFDKRKQIVIKFLDEPNDTTKKINVLSSFQTNSSYEINLGDIYSLLNRSEDGIKSNMKIRKIWASIKNLINGIISEIGDWANIFSNDSKKKFINSMTNSAKKLSGNIIDNTSNITSNLVFLRFGISNSIN